VGKTYKRALSYRALNSSGFIQNYKNAKPYSFVQIYTLHYYFIESFKIPYTITIPCSMNKYMMYVFILCSMLQFHSVCYNSMQSVSMQCFVFNAPCYNCMQSVIIPWSILQLCAVCHNSMQSGTITCTLL